ncbi:ABC transporter permease [Nonomuraea jiangxiensis]|uniref:ABC-2 family transporter protein n=1 Tax=Nonomuraea jiangxiensis TaxID=633440 RepID=A0A1G9L4T6_9ACTN|nr:ABC transporter permease subunit [Nonomuraea jiangxiensis]SDL57038.1 ABC-2 family transporter protein [Nonomuraea jiangxiensis]
MTHILRSEWTKIRSVRSTVWTLAATAVLMLGLSALLSASVKSQADGPIPGGEAIATSLMGSMFASLSMAALGVLVISSEYRTGSIRTSLMAVPTRMRLLIGKIVVFTIVSLVVCAVAAAGSIGVGLAISQPPSVDLGQLVWSTMGCSAYLTACGLFGLGLGTLIRHTPGALVSAIALMLVLPPLTYQLPGEWGKAVNAYFTTNAGQLIVTGRANDFLGPVSGFGVYLAWVAVAMVAGAVLLQRRDA